MFDVSLKLVIPLKWFPVVLTILWSQEPNTHTAMIRPRSKKYLSLLVMGSLVPSLLTGGKNVPPRHISGNNNPIA